MKALSFKAKIILLVTGSSLFLTLITTTLALVELSAERERTTAQLRKTLMDDFDTNAKTLVETALSTIRTVHEQTVAEGGSIEEAKRRAAAALRGMRYGTSGYFWADTSKGENVVMLGKADVEGKNRIDIKDARGKELIREIISVALKGGGYTDYWFPKPGDSTPLPKRSYSAYYQPFDWVIGEMIKAIQQKTKEAVTAMEEGVREVERGTGDAARSGDALALILEQVNAVTLQINQIATAAEEQTATTREISTNIQQISDVVEMGARSTQEISQAAAGLSRLSVELQEIIRRFRV